MSVCEAIQPKSTRVRDDSYKFDTLLALMNVFVREVQNGRIGNGGRIWFGKVTMLNGQVRYVGQRADYEVGDGFG